MRENKKFFVVSALLFIAFILFTILIKTVDVVAIGPQGREVGLSSINRAVSEAIGHDETLYRLSTIFGKLAIATAFIFVLFGIMQFHFKKGFKNIDKDLYALTGLYAIGLILCVVFEKVLITDIILAVTFIGAAAAEFSVRLKAKKVRKVIILICVLDGAGVIVTRFLSGAHWLTDIIGSLFISGACLTLFLGVFKVLIDKKKSS